MTDILRAPKLASDSLLPAPAGKYVPYFLLAFAVLCFYGNVYDNAMLYDDEFLIVNNRYLRSLHYLGDIFSSCIHCGALKSTQFYRPLQMLLYLIVYQIGGLSLFGFHFLNIVLHIANACLVYALRCRLGFNIRAVFLASLLWALHPAHTEAVTYMSGTADGLYSFFCLLGLLVLLPDFAPRKFLMAALLLILGILGKETALVFPALVMCSMYLTQRERFSPSLYLRTWPLWAVVFLYLGLRSIFMPVSGADFINPSLQDYETHMSLRLYTFLATVPSYVGLLIWPVGLHMDRDFPVQMNPWSWQVGLGALTVGAAAAQIIWGRGKRGLPFSWGLMWFACTQIPQTGILMPVNSAFCEHWMYLPSAGLFLGIAQTIAVTLHDYRARISAAAGAVLVALILGAMTYRQNTVWHDPISLYTSILDHGETSVRARINLAKAYIQQGDDDQAMEQLQAAVKYNDVLPSAHQNIAAIYLARRDFQDAIAELKKAVEIDPDYLDAWDGLAIIYNYLGDKPNADLYRRKAAEIRKRFGS